MTTSVKIHVNGQYRATVLQRFTDGSRQTHEIEGNYNGESGEKTFFLPHPAHCSFEVKEVYVADDDKKPGPAPKEDPKPDPKPAKTEAGTESKDKADAEK